MTTTDTMPREVLVKNIIEAETRLNDLRSQRDHQIIDAYQQGVSKYRLAKDWAVSENTITRIVTGTRPGATS